LRFGIETRGEQRGRCPHDLSIYDDAREPLMDEAEIRAEIERRRQKAKALNLREALWSLYSSHFKYIDQNLSKEPEMILPSVRESLRRSKNTSEFKVGDSDWSLSCTEGKEERDGRGFDATETTPMTMALSVDGKRVFEFEMTLSITYGQDMPYFNESMRTVKAFIEGPWVQQMAKLAADMDAFRREVWKQKNAPREAQKLKDDMKRFGL
jgi:hypothetical protein